MKPALTVARREAIDRDELLVRDWRVAQLKRLGIPGPLADGAAANHVDWHEIARLIPSRLRVRRLEIDAGSVQRQITRSAEPRQPS
jgi:hypothetical protein